jgi:hypothetical protein
MDAAEDAVLTPVDRLEVQLKLMLQNPKDCPKTADEQQTLMESIIALFPQEKSTGQRAIDFHQDARMIRSAFLRMGYDLTRDHMHFFKFCELLADIPSDTALARTVDIRLRPIPKPTKYNAEQIRALQEAKAKVAIKLSAEDARESFMTALKRSAALRG